MSAVTQVQAESKKTGKKAKAAPEQTPQEAGQEVFAPFEMGLAAFPSMAAPPPNSIQTKLRIGAVNDRFEQEADRMADRVVREVGRPSETGAQFSGGAPPLQRQCAACSEEEKLRRSPAAPKSAPPTPSAGVQSALSASKGAGQPLPAHTRQQMGQAFGADFNGVRVHSGARAATLNQALNARAFTHGADIYFDRGEFNPSSRSGQHLLAHELTHVLQQQAAAPISIQRACRPLAEIEEGWTPAPDSEVFQTQEAAEAWIEANRPSNDGFEVACFPNA
ncbi:MAG: DUF4157 domain-containing protein, partial [Bacteroidota bacterium]